VTLFNTNAFDLAAYLARIGYRGDASAHIGTLRELTLLHPCAIPFENLNPLLRRPVRLDIASIQEKLVLGGRGGWCFEHNLLMGHALAALGYDVIGLSARVVWNVPPGVVRGRSHMVLLVTLDDGRYIVDVGFGGSTPTGPLRVEAGIEQATPHEPFRLMPVDGGFLLEAKLEGTWKGLYVFDLQPQALADYEMPNWYLCNHPESHFLVGVVAARVERDRRYALRNTDFAVHFPHGVTERRVLGSAAEIRQVLADVFRITVPDWPEVDDTLARLADAIPATVHRHQPT
jgi:N-hydroxyarylamine O-acetyltransferase